MYSVAPSHRAAIGPSRCSGYLATNYIDPAAIYVFDQSYRESFQRVQDWRLVIRANNPNLSILFGNPTDNSLAVSYEEAANYASTQGLVYILGDAKSTAKAKSVLSIIAGFAIIEINHCASN